MGSVRFLAPPTGLPTPALRGVRKAPQASPKNPLSAHRKNPSKWELASRPTYFSSKAHLCPLDDLYGEVARIDRRVIGIARVLNRAVVCARGQACNDELDHAI